MSGKRVLLVGATGNFGSHLLSNLARVDGIHVLAASRDKARAEQAVSEVGAQNASAASFDTSGDVAAQLEALAPWLVIDASGPFQGADYSLPKAVLQAGAHHIDLADARAYLLGFGSALDGLARQQGRVALSGASSTPALSGAVVAALAQGWRRVDTVDMAIVPDGVGHVGESTVRAVTSYAGEDVLQFRFGGRHVETGWLRHEHVHVAGLPKRRVAAVETVDADDLPRRFGVTSRVRFLAGLESQLEMRGLQALSMLRAKRLLPELGRFSSLLAAGRRITRMFGSQKGGMLVRITGINGEGAWTEAEWSLVADKGCGPNIPGLPAVAAVRLLLADKAPSGARIAREIALDDMEREMAHHPITVSRRARAGVNVFERALGDVLEQLPKPVAAFHKLDAPVEWRGRAAVSRGSSLAARLAGWVLGLPEAAEEVDVAVSVERQAQGTETWTRRFGQAAFHSVLTADEKGQVWERFGALTFALGLRVENGRLHYPIRKGRAFGIPIPKWLLPTSDTFETMDEQGRFRFDVRLGLPVFGLLVHYRGWLVPKA